MVGSLFSQYHSGIDDKILILVLHSHPTGIFALASHRLLILSKSSLFGMNDDSFKKYPFLTSSIGVTGLTTHKHEASYSYTVTSHSDSFGKFFEYHKVETTNSDGVDEDGNFHVILEIVTPAVSTFVISLLVIYHHLTNHHRNSFNGWAWIVPP